MALTNCPDCNAQLSTDATVCPGCARPRPETDGERVTRLVGLGVGLAAMAGALAWWMVTHGAQ